MHEPILAEATGSLRLKEILEAHPFVRVVKFSESPNLTVNFERAGRRRCVSQGFSPNVVYGLPELMDNNPLVCADSASCPSPAATLVAIAANPLAKAGLLEESPALVFSFEDDFTEVGRILETEGWMGGAHCAGNPMDMQGVLTATCLASIKQQDISELRALYEECFGRSFFVRRFDGDSWTAELVRGKPFALYNLMPSAGDQGHCMLRVDVLADANGKGGACQLVHMLNIMCGFEEDMALGLQNHIFR